MYGLKQKNFSQKFQKEKEWYFNSTTDGDPEKWRGWRPRRLVQKES